MSKYRVHSITVWKEDSKKAKSIIDTYRAYFDDMCIESRSHTVAYWLNPYLSEGIDMVISKIEQAGIQVL